MPRDSQLKKGQQTGQGERCPQAWVQVKSIQDQVSTGAWFWPSSYSASAGSHCPAMGVGGGDGC